MTTRILLVEDDRELSESLGRYLSAGGFEVSTLDDAASLMEEMERLDPDVVVLDINLPSSTGFEAAARVRARKQTGLIILTGRAMRDDRLQGLAAGADHYIVKPADPAELEMVIRNLHRRLSNEAAEAAVPSPASDTWRLDLTRWSLVAPTGVPMALTSSERHLILRLMRTPGQPVPRHELLPPYQQKDPEAEVRGLDVMVFRLRRKVERECGCPLPLLSARGVGYVFAGTVELQGEAG